MNKPWSRQKKLQDETYATRMPNIKEVSEIAMGIADERTRALFIMAYQTAGRINEIVNKVKKEDCYIMQDKDKRFLMINMPNEKNKKRKRKELAIPIHKEIEMTKALVDYLESLPDKSLAFGFSDERARQLLSGVGMNPHFLRHLRATHLATVYDFSDQLLTRFMGWSDSRPANRYVELRSQDFFRKF